MNSQKPHDVFMTTTSNTATTESVQWNDKFHCYEYICRSGTVVLGATDLDEAVIEAQGYIDEVECYE